MWSLESINIYVSVELVSSLLDIVVFAFSLYHLFFKHASEVLFNVSFAAALTYIKVFILFSIEKQHWSEHSLPYSCFVSTAAVCLKQKPHKPLWFGWS